MRPTIEPPDDPLPRPWARHLAPDEIAAFTASGEYCGTRKCRQPAAVVTWRWFRSTAAGRVLVAERFVCTGHGGAFARRHHVEIGPAPEGSES